MNVVIVPFIVVIRAILNLVYCTVVLHAIIETLFAFNIINLSHRRICIFRAWLYNLVDPMLEPLRRRLPHLKMIDLAPLALLLIILFFHVMLSEILVLL